MTEVRRGFLDGVLTANRKALSFAARIAVLDTRVSGQHNVEICNSANGLEIR